MLPAFKQALCQVDTEGFFFAIITPRALLNMDPRFFEIQSVRHIKALGIAPQSRTREWSILKLEKAPVLDFTHPIPTKTR